MFNPHLRSMKLLETDLRVCFIVEGSSRCLTVMGIQYSDCPSSWDFAWTSISDSLIEGISLYADEKGLIMQVPFFKPVSGLVIRSVGVCITRPAGPGKLFRVYRSHYLGIALGQFAR